MLSQCHMVVPSYLTQAMLALDLGSQGHLWSEKNHNVMVEADIHLKQLHTSILDLYKVFEPLLCYLTGIWLHLYTITPAKLAPDLGSWGHLWRGNDAIMSWLRLKSTSDCSVYPF